MSDNRFQQHGRAMAATTNEKLHKRPKKSLAEQGKKPTVTNRAHLIFYDPFDLTERPTLGTGTSKVEKQPREDEMGANNRLQRHRREMEPTKSPIQCRSPKKSQIEQAEQSLTKKRARLNLKLSHTRWPTRGGLDDKDVEFKPTGTSGTPTTRSTEGWTLLRKTQVFWKRQRQRDRSRGDSLMHEENKESTNRGTPITGQQKGGDSRGRQTKRTSAPDRGHRRASTPTASNQTRTRTPPSSLWDDYTPDQFKIHRMDFRERTDPDTKDIIITEHWGDDQIQNCRNLAQRVGIAIVTTIAALAPLGKHVFQIIEDTTTVETDPKRTAELDCPLGWWFSTTKWKLRRREQMRTRRNSWLNLTEMVAPQEIDRGPPLISRGLFPLPFFFSTITDLIDQHN